MCDLILRHNGRNYTIEFTLARGIRNNDNVLQIGSIQMK